LRNAGRAAVAGRAQQPDALLWQLDRDADVAGKAAPGGGRRALARQRRRAREAAVEAVHGVQHRHLGELVGPRAGVGGRHFSHRDFAPRPK